VFELFPVLKQMLHRRGGDLSGGQQQQLAIGRALVIEPIAHPRRAHRGIQPNIVHEIGDVLSSSTGPDMTVLLVEQSSLRHGRVAPSSVFLKRLVRGCGTSKR